MPQTGGRTGRRASRCCRGAHPGRFQLGFKDVLRTETLMQLPVDAGLRIDEASTSRVKR
jgi:hypothetical protein